MSPTNDAPDEVQSQEKQGTTRKSAASAKPASQAASSVYVPRNAPQKKGPKSPLAKMRENAEKRNKPKTKAEKREAQEARELRQFQDEARNFVPTTQKYKRLRFLFWATISLAIAFTLYALFLIATQGPVAGRIWFGVGSILVAAAIYIDTSKVRQEREEAYKAYLDEQKSPKKKPAAATARDTATQADKADTSTEAASAPAAGADVAAEAETSGTAAAVTSTESQTELREADAGDAPASGN